MFTSMALIREIAFVSLWSLCLPWSCVVKCMSCGPRGVGQCVGPSICCGPDIGCLMGTPEAEVCQKENESTTPCSVSGRQCGVNNMGNCVADSICCDEDACSYNSLCKDSDSETETTRQELLSLVRRLLVNRQYD